MRKYYTHGRRKKKTSTNAEKPAASAAGCKLLEQSKRFKDTELCAKPYPIYLIVQTISHLLFGNNGLKYPLIQLGFTIHNCTCDFSLIPDSGYTGSPSTKTPLTLS